MTTFQDPPPQSRRAVRQSERGEAPTQSLPYSFDPDSQVSEDAERAAQNQPAPQISGRRAQLPQSAAVSPQPGSAQSGFEPLTYVTQGRPVASTTGSIETPEAPREVPPTSDAYRREPLTSQAPPTIEQPTYRVRDFSPEGRRAAISREQFAGISQVPLAAPATPTPAPAALDGLANIDSPAIEVPAVRSHVATPPTSDDSIANHTLTRRELRELRAAQEEPPALKLPEPIDALLNSGPIDIPVLSAVPGQSQALADAMAEFDVLTRGRRAAEARVAETSATEAPGAEAPVLEVPVEEVPLPVAVVPAFQTPSAEIAPEPSVPVISASIPLPVTSDPWPAPAPARAVSIPDLTVTPVPEVAPEPVDDVVAQPAPMEPVFLEPDREPLTPPIGHWSVQAQIDDDEQPLDNLISRTVGSGNAPVTTSALVLPSVPQSADLTSPFGATGEILVTGSIDLPHSLSSTGAHPHRVDNSDFEDDPLDSEVPSTDSAPVRAIRAVSTHTSTRGVIESKRPQNNRMPTIMIIAASVLAVGVVGLLVAAAVMHLFG